MAPAPPSRSIAPTSADSDRTFRIALIAAAVLHLALIGLVSFEDPEIRNRSMPESAMEVLILRDRGIATRVPARDAALSQQSRAGASPAGDAGIDEPMTAAPEAIAPVEPPEPLAEVIPESPASIPAAPTRPSEVSIEPIGPAPGALEAIALQAETRDPSALLPVPTSESAPAQTPTPPPATLEADEPAEQDPDVGPITAPPAVDAARILASRGEAISRLESDLQAKSNAYAHRVRRKSVSAATREFRYASYLAAWAHKVERIGNLNYPQAARDQRLFGSLILHVAVRSDGSIERVRVVRSSGYDLLDDAARRIVELAAPFAPFPPDIAAETDVLDIVRTWQFLRGGGLAWDR